MGTVSPFRRFADGLANVLTGRGTTVDRAVSNFWVRRFTSAQQVEAAYLSSWLHRKIVDVPAEDMTRAGRDWDTDDESISKIEAEEKRLDYWAKLREAVRLGRLGGGAILIGLGDDPANPLPSTVRPGAIQYLMVLSRWQLNLGELENDPGSSNFMQPRYFELSGTSSSVRIHPSRVVCFKGLPIPALQGAATTEDRFWGMSVVEAVDEAVQQATTACAGFNALIDEAKVDVFRFNGLAETLLQADGDAKIMKRVEITNTGKSVHRAVVLDSEDEWEQRQLTLTGVRDVIITYDARVAGAADIPATRLFGKSPDGQNSTGESDIANYFQSIGSKQEMDLRPGMDQIDALMLPSAGVATDELSWAFSPLRVLSEKDQAEIENKEADSVSKIVTAGLVPESALAKAVQNRLIETQRWPGLKDAIDKANAEGLPEGDEGELGLVPVGRGGDPVSRGGGSGLETGAARRANDAAPRTLYARRDVMPETVRALKAWAKEQGLPALQDGLHVTIVHIDKAFDWMKVDGEWSQKDDGSIEIPPGGVRIVEPLGDRTAVLLFTSSQLSWRHESILRAADAQHNFPSYQPHISLTGEPVDLSAVEPFRGKVVLGPEIFEEVST